MPTKRDRDVEKGLAGLGFEFDHVSSKGVRHYVHPGSGAAVSFPLGCDERRSRDVLKQAQRALGLPTKLNKRDPAAIRERRAAEAALQRARRDLEAMLAGKDEGRIRAAERVLEAAERQLAYWDRLMREIPGGAA